MHLIYICTGVESAAFPGQSDEEKDRLLHMVRLDNYIFLRVGSVPVFRLSVCETKMFPSYSGPPFDLNFFVSYSISMIWRLYTNFLQVVVGGGPTGIELSGELRDFLEVRPIFPMSFTPCHLTLYLYQL